jgi:hypothetical protein
LESSTEAAEGAIETVTPPGGAVKVTVACAVDEGLATEAARTMTDEDAGMFAGAV